MGKVWTATYVDRYPAMPIDDNAMKPADMGYSFIKMKAIGDGVLWAAPETSALSIIILMAGPAYSIIILMAGPAYSIIILMAGLRSIWNNG